ncbi:MAG: hypothetical protein Q7S00_04970 [bacterium]|nr:hypothetical protein [bacterium]
MTFNDKSDFVRLVPFLILLSLTLSPMKAFANSFHLDSGLTGQVRDNESAQREVPLNGTLGLGTTADKWDFSGQTDMRLFRDTARGSDDYDLYQATLHIKPVETIEIDAGRQFINEGFSVGALDGLRLQLFPSKPVTFTVYSGMPRSVELGDFNQDDGLLTGASIKIQQIPRTDLKFDFAWKRDSINTADFNQNDSLFVGTNISHKLPVKGDPYLYGLFEYDLTAKVMNAGTAGLDITPLSRLALNAEFNYFNVNREFNRPSILSLFTEGRTLSGRLGSTTTLISNRLDFVQSYTYQSIEIQNTLQRNGHILETAFQIFFDSIGLQIQPGYYFEKSFGGQLHGVRMGFSEQFTDRWTADTTVDYTTYDKVTNNNDNAFSTIVWSGYELLKGWTVAGGFEYNRNNEFKKDVRGSFKVEYAFDHP